jgi:hypothetical protein
MRDGLLALFCVAVGGCSYDWAVGPGAADGGGDVLGADVAADVDVAADGPADASTDHASDAVVLPDVAEAAPLPDCSSTEEQQVQQARAAALVCTGVTPAPCMVTVTDECGCEVVVATDNTAEAQYVAAIKTMEETCKPLCPTACGTAPTEGLCILSDAGGGALACSQQ